MYEIYDLEQGSLELQRKHATRFEEKMTNTQIDDIYKEGLKDGRIAGLRAVWNAGWYEGKGITPASSSSDQSIQPAKPVAVVKAKKK